MKSLFLSILWISGMMMWLLVSFSCVDASMYTDRQIDRVVESYASKWERKDRKPYLEKVQSILPVAKERMKDSPTALWLLNQIEASIVGKLSICTSSEAEFEFDRFKLKTDTSIRSIDLKEVLSGGPPKDGIPALNDPAFLSITEASSKNFLTDSSEWIVVHIGDEKKFYPYNILNRHEIVNDVVWGKPIAITFCPLCGTAIVFEREFDGQKVNFWVSWKLYNSNLLMYDDRTESLRSQAIGKWVIGFYTDYQLEYVDSDVMEYVKFATDYPDGEVLSDETWFSRNYDIDSPYGDYNSNDDLYFPVNNSDESLPKKTILYVANDTENDVSVAFHLQNLNEAKSASLEANGIIYSATVDDGKVSIVRNGEELGSFTQMWFSWVAHEAGERFLWK